MNLVLYRNALAGSNTGGIRETQEFVDFCAAKKIKPQITKISMSEIYKSWDTIVRKNARYRFVVDMTNA
jgi:uncharacterized zinc-type alcohol dehydrogenase-like protein